MVSILHFKLSEKFKGAKCTGQAKMEFSLRIVAVLSVYLRSMPTKHGLGFNRVSLRKMFSYTDKRTCVATEWYIYDFFCLTHWMYSSSIKHFYIWSNFQILKDTTSRAHEVFRGGIVFSSKYSQSSLWKTRVFILVYTMSDTLQKKI